MHSPRSNRKKNSRRPRKASDCSRATGFEIILDSLDAIVYVADMHSYELLFLNSYGRQHYGDPAGMKCWQLLQAGQTGPCDFCSNPQLLDANGEPAGVYVWEFRNTRTGRWYECHDQARHWADGRLVRIEIATDITERKRMEEELAEAKRQAEALAHIDELTGLNNRRAFFQLGLQAFRQAARAASPIAVVMFDLDHFKQINDVHGHFVGDKVLVAVANSVREHVREADIAGRLGGEEFALILPQTSLPEALVAAERLRGTIAATRLAHGETRIRCTSSFGVAVCADGSQDLEHMLSQADAALYRAKHNGRNRVEHAGP
ncbi:diguanylate cyclase [Azotobacter chroococcum subsp. isscasi]|uniref:sensor domain-containing diguanylate cyclase n=1 Tax=Azotobacter chroococcum TaxID=353 RepID=UPI00103FD363|nr:diguanylate cyclase [Azotobacter chroococcum]TBW09457.1 diguanylate cyclase [Azotobacter chroococcum subsp. isscasi]